jgi:hypothetical protein
MHKKAFISGYMQKNAWKIPSPAQVAPVLKALSAIGGIGGMFGGWHTLWNKKTNPKADPYSKKVVAPVKNLWGDVHKRNVALGIEEDSGRRGLNRLANESADLLLTGHFTQRTPYRHEALKNVNEALRTVPEPLRYVLKGSTWEDLMKLTPVVDAINSNPSVSLRELYTTDKTLNTQDRAIARKIGETPGAEDALYKLHNANRAKGSPPMLTSPEKERRAAQWKNDVNNLRLNSRNTAEYNLGLRLLLEERGVTQNKTQE